MSTPEYHKYYNQTHKEQIKAYRTKAKANDPERFRGYARDHAHRLRLQVVEGYGGMCVCCGISDYEFLALNHVLGNGAEDRKTRSAYTLFRQCIANNFPPEYDLLCHNCNMAYGIWGYCPHTVLDKD